jgi:predicted CxxxxCH...CXXCH cytochrome family protein
VTGKYNFGCSACHPLTPGQHTTGTILIDFRPAVAGVGTLRAKNSALITAGSVVAGTANSGTTGTSGTSVKCFNIYCHSNGYATTTVYATTPDWYGGAFAGDRCANCHGNSPNSTITGSPAHYNTNFIGTGTTSGHVVGIHYNDISNGATGEATAGTGTANSHGNSLYSSTMNCDTCHYATVTSAANDKNMICTTCHNGTQATLRGNAAIANKAFHVSGSVNVAFNPIAFKSKAQIRQGSFSKYSGAFTRPAGYKAAGSYDQAKLVFNTVTMWSSGSKTCSNISCHNGQTVVWTATGGGTSCSSCHTSL